MLTGKRVEGVLHLSQDGLGYPTGVLGTDYMATDDQVIRACPNRRSRCRMSLLIVNTLPTLPNARGHDKQLVADDIADRRRLSSRRNDAVAARLHCPLRSMQD